MPHAPRPDLDPDDLDLIRLVVRDFLATRTASPGFEFDDLVQESALHWWQQRSRYDESRGASQKTFLRRVVTAKLQDLARGSRAAKRGSGRASISLDAPTWPGKPDAPTLRETLADPRTANSTLALDIQQVIRRLSPRQRRIISAKRLGLRNTEISKRLDISRTTVQDEISAIRDIFRDAGLAPFLED